MVIEYDLIRLLSLKVLKKEQNVLNKGQKQKDNFHFSGFSDIKISEGVKHMKKDVDLSDLYTETLELRALIQTLWVITVDNHEEKSPKRDRDNHVVDTAAIAHMALEKIDKLYDQIELLEKNNQTVSYWGILGNSST